MARIKLNLQKPWIPYVILIVTLLLTTATTYYVNRTTHERDRLRFANSVQETENTINNELEVYTTLLRGTTGLFAANPDVSKTEFQSYINRLFLQQNYRGIQGIGYIKRVPADQKDVFVQTMQEQLQSNFTIRSNGNRSEYNVILYLQPEKNMNQAGIGLDMNNDPIRKAALARARDTGRPAMSPRVILNQTPTQTRQTGFLIFVPIYANGSVPATVDERRKEISGFVFSPFRTNNLFTTDRPSSLTFQIYDGDTTDKKNLIHDSSNPNDQALKNYQPVYQTIHHLTFDGEKWTVVYSNHPIFEDASQTDLPPFIFLGGVLVSLMFFTLSRSQYTARNRAELYANELQNSQHELHKAIGLRDNFISIASHELKTPVTSLKVYTEVLLKQSTKKEETKTTDYLSKMNRQIDKLTLLIHDLLDVTRLQAGHLTYRIEEFDIAKLVHEIVENTEQLANNHQIIIKGKVKKNVWGDRERINQVLTNLLTNAIKYSPGAKKIIVTMQEKKDETQISVQDFGIGISKEHQKKIFNRFYRVNDTSEKTFPGLGLGLFISNEIAKYHGGQISIKSTRKDGSIFSFSLPHSQTKIKKSS